MKGHAWKILLLATLVSACTQKAPEVDPSDRAEHAEQQSATASQGAAENPTACRPESLPMGLEDAYQVDRSSTYVRKDGKNRRASIVKVPAEDSGQTFDSIVQSLTAAGYVSRSNETTRPHKKKSSFAKKDVGMVYVTSLRKKGEPEIISVDFPDLCPNP